MRCKAIRALKINTSKQKHFSCQPKALKTTRGSWEKLGNAKEQEGKTGSCKQMSQSWQGILYPWMLRSSHHTLLLLCHSTEDLTQPVTLQKKEETAHGKFKKTRKVVFKSFPPMPHSISDAHQLRKEGDVISYLSTETLPHAWDAN